VILQGAPELAQSEFHHRLKTSVSVLFVPSIGMAN